MGFCLSKELQRSNEFKGREIQAKESRSELLCSALCWKESYRLLVDRYPVYHHMWLDRMLLRWADSWVPGQRQWLQMSQTVIAAGKTRLSSSFEVLRT